jgi:signal transduction histidine kinase
LLGEKREGGFYSQEEMEIAQATGERVLQFLAREQMLQRLLELQRTRKVEQRVMDLHTRRTLHDEILPALHLAVLQLSGAAQGSFVSEALHSLAAAHRQIAALLTDTQPAPVRAPDPCNLRVSLRTLVDTEFAHHFAEVHWHEDAAPANAAPGGIYVDALMGEVMVGAAREVIRNTALHGRGGKTDFPLRLDITLGMEEGELTLAIRDNGVGIDASRGQALSGGSGSGLALHSTLLAMIGGYLTAEALEAGGTLVIITVAKEAHR